MTTASSLSDLSVGLMERSDALLSCRVLPPRRKYQMQLDGQQGGSSAGQFSWNAKRQSPILWQTGAKNTPCGSAGFDTSLFPMTLLMPLLSRSVSQITGWPLSEKTAFTKSGLPRPGQTKTTIQRYGCSYSRMLIARATCRDFPLGPNNGAI